MIRHRGRRTRAPSASSSLLQHLLLLLLLLVHLPPGASAAARSHLGVARSTFLACEAECANATDDTARPRCRVDWSEHCQGCAYYVATPQALIPLLGGLAFLCCGLAFPVLRVWGRLGGCVAGAGGPFDRHAEKEHQQAYFARPVWHPYHPCVASYALPAAAAGLMVLSVATGAVALYSSRSLYAETFEDLANATQEFYVPYWDRVSADLTRGGEYYVTTAGLQTRMLGDDLSEAKAATQRQVQRMEREYASVGTTQRDAVDGVLLAATLPFVLAVSLLSLLKCSRNYRTAGNLCAYSFVWIVTVVGFVAWMAAGASGGLLVAYKDVCFEVSQLRVPPEEPRTLGYVEAEIVEDMCPDLRFSVRLVRASAVTAARLVCHNLAPHCSPAAAYDAARPEEWFVCPQRLGAVCGRVPTAGDAGAVWDLQDADAAAAAHEDGTAVLPAAAELLGYRLKEGVPESVRGGCTGVCDVARCGKEANGTGCGAGAAVAAGRVVAVVRDEETVARYYADVVRPLEACRTLKVALSEALDEPCAQLESLNTYRMAGMVLAALCFGTVAVAAALGVKRWIPQEGTGMGRRLADGLRRDHVEMDEPFSDGWEESEDDECRHGGGGCGGRGESSREAGGVASSQGAGRRSSRRSSGYSSPVLNKGSVPPSWASEYPDIEAVCERN